MIIALTGYMAAGKTAVGKELSEILGFDFIDLDDFIEVFTGLSPAEIIRQYGERTLRIWENKALNELLLERDDLVLALGGGTVTEAFNLNMLKNYTLLVFVDTSLQNIMKRIGENPGDRPLLVMKDGRPDKEAVIKHYQQRLPVYRQAHVHFENRFDDAAQAARMLVKQLKEEGHVR